MSAIAPRRSAAIAAIAAACVADPAMSADWPAWRADAARSAVVAEGPADGLRPAWSRRYGAFPTAFAYDDDAAIDRGPDPVAAGGMVFTTAPDDAIEALDAATGARRWRVQLLAPVRFAPTHADGRLYVGADDGVLRCLDAADGREIWRRRVAPGERRTVAHGRVVSAWPISNAPLVAEGRVHVAAGVFGSDDIFAAAYDARSGAPLWMQDDIGARGSQVVAPAGCGAIAWGYPALSAGRLILAAAGNPPAVLDAASGGMRGRPSLAAYNTWRWQISATGGWLHCGFMATALNDLRTQVRSYVNADKPTLERPPLLVGEQWWGVNDSILTRGRLSATRAKPALAIDGQWWLGGRMPYPWSNQPQQAAIAVPEGLRLPDGFMLRELHAVAGDRLIASGPGAVVVLSLSEPPRLLAVCPVPGTVVRAIVADGRLFASNDLGELHAFAAAGTAAPEPVRASPSGR